MAGFLSLAVLGTSGCRPGNESDVPMTADGRDVAPGTGTGVPEDLMSLEPEPEFVPDPATPELTIDKSAEVAILGYHDFTEGVSKNPMVINVDDFRRHMEAIRDSGLAVISMEEFLAWRREEGEIPANSVMITIDDGWKSTYQLAFPVLREFDFPFTIFLYSRYVGGGGRALTVSEIEEMRDWGATIGCHSYSHPFPARIRTASKGAPEEYDAFLMREMDVPRKFLRETFGVPVTTYAYPGGMMTERMISLNDEAIGYEALFTCNPAKTTWDTPMAELNRYIVYGDDPKDANFRLATTFSSTGVSALDIRKFAGGADAEHPVIPLDPPDQAMVSDRQPVIRADFSEVPDVLPESFRVRVSGFGEVPASFDPESRVLTYQPRRIIREESVAVSVQFLRSGQSTPEVVGWRFGIDRLPHYQAAAGVDQSTSGGEGSDEHRESDPRGAETSEESAPADESAAARGSEVTVDSR